ncbi:HAMP domain-containing histidine kinase [Candidatus Azambacteria bacterium]|nr:HAMP domain-containing histidine kinase [Candidatus Azambacteria bacterium]
MSDEIKKPEEVSAKDKELLDFFAIASHKMRSPLSGIKMMIETIKRGSLGEVPEKQMEYLSDIHKINANMIGLSLDIFEALRLKTTTVNASKEKIPLSEFLKNIFERLEPAAKKAGVMLRNEANISESLEIETDKKMLGVILENLLSNAINYSKAGQEVFFGVKDDSGRLIFSIKDSGIGIPKDEKEKILGPCYRASNAKEFKQLGTGRGLYISRMLAKKLGGEVSCESEEDKGSVFYLNIQKSGV